MLLVALQAKDAGMWKDDVVVVHIKSKSKGKEKEPWDQGGAVIASLKTALQPYKHDVFDLEVCGVDQSRLLLAAPGHCTYMRACTLIMDRLSRTRSFSTLLAAMQPLQHQARRRLCYALQGDPGPLLVDIANKEQADILVLGALAIDACSGVLLRRCSSRSSSREEEGEDEASGVLAGAAAVAAQVVTWQPVATLNGDSSFLNAHMQCQTSPYAYSGCCLHAFAVVLCSNTRAQCHEESHDGQHNRVCDAACELRLPGDQAASEQLAKGLFSHGGIHVLGKQLATVDAWASGLLIHVKFLSLQSSLGQDARNKERQKG